MLTDLAVTRQELMFIEVFLCEQNLPRPFALFTMFIFTATLRDQLCACSSHTNKKARVKFMKLERHRTRV